jgi:acyl carrier protein
VIERIESIFKDIFDDQTITLNLESGPDQINGWDSMAHIDIIMAIESEFKTKFTLQEISAMKTIRDIISTLENKQER